MGDEGKGRVADWLARESDVMARYGGGDNAGHTVQVGEKNFKLHLVPSGVVHPNLICIMGTGMVINPLRLVGELDMLAGEGVDVSPDRIHLSPRAHIITPGHMELDGAEERMLEDESIGTTRRGIGPAYSDKAARIGLLTGEMADPDQFAAKVRLAIGRANQLLKLRYRLDPIHEDVVDQYHAAAVRLKPY